MKSPAFAVALGLAMLTPSASMHAEDGGRAAQEAAIRHYRMGTLVIEGAPGTAVKVEQTRHEFWFGAAIASAAFDGGLPAADTTKYREVFLENFNAAVPENALKWLSMERTRGTVDYGTVDAILAWTEEHHLPLRGHNLYWGIPKFVQPWLKEMNDATLRTTLEARGRGIAGRYRGRFAEYDLNNEMMHEDYYAQRLGPGITADMARWVQEEDPGAVLFLNDYDILTGKRLDEFVAHVRRMQQLGVPVGGLGVQGHLHGEAFEPAALRHALDVLAQFHLPIRVTEFNLPGQRSRFLKDRALQMTPAEEEAKAKAITDYYRICFTHPAVDGILMWGFWAGDNWIPASSLFKRDWTPTPAAQAYHDLIYKEWWTRWEGTVGADGRCEVPAFYGSYRISAGDKTVDAELRKADGLALVKLP
ncbi:MAG TPA: endo-1,4-beta-xylanase [Opitutus sp.]|nr:endo-1,4-beta-xylanase [Opitutus sp.]